MNPITLAEPFQLSAEWSWLFVAWLFPLGPLAFAGWWLVRAVRFELRRRDALSPAPGYRAVEGTILPNRKRNSPAVEATFELEVKKLKRGRGYRLRSHAISVRPFTLETTEGQRFEVRPDRDAVALHAPLEGEHASLTSRVGAGDKVWVYGPAAVISAAAIAPEGSSREPQPAGHRPSLLISTLPIAEVFRLERNRRLWLAAAAAAFLVAAELAVFGGYWDVVRAGEPAVGQVVDKASEEHRHRERTGGSRWDVEYELSVDVDGRRQELDVTADGWAQVDVGTKVALLLSPTTAMLGPEPHTTLHRCVVMSALVFFGLLGFVVAELIQRPWYSVKRGWRGMDRPPPQNRKPE